MCLLDHDAFNSSNRQLIIARINSSLEIFGRNILTFLSIICHQRFNRCTSNAYSMPLLLLLLSPASAADICCCPPAAAPADVAHAADAATHYSLCCIHLCLLLLSQLLDICSSGMSPRAYSYLIVDCRAGPLIGPWPGSRPGLEQAGADPGPDQAGWAWAGTSTYMPTLKIVRLPIIMILFLVRTVVTMLLWTRTDQWFDILHWPCRH